ncbi:MAG TPA: ferritin family protein [Rubrivivax sp.]|nr:ferritin family protein [Rubrivivax sp.]HPP82714.1 ferritin family protein [Rubrivivax sp.]
MSICPRCQQPLDDDEPYICCAGRELRWRCTSCQKVSEGFAFPYGMCPHCKGRLELLERDGVEDDAALAAVRKAFEIEIGGHAYYTRVALEAKDPVLSELFGRFAAMEQEHMTTLARRYHAELPAPSSDFQIDRAAIFTGVERRPEDPANLFRIAIAFEQRAVEFFTREGERAPAGSVERQLYLELAAEEREHVELLGTEYRRWESGRSGIL